MLVVAGAIVFLLYPRQKEDLVVHRQTEGHAEHDQRRGRVDVAGRAEVERAGQVALLEDPHHGPEGGGQAEDVEHERFHGHDHAAEEHEEGDEGDQGDDAERERHPSEQRRF